MVGTQLSFDDVLDLCRHEHRRILLGALAPRQEAYTMEELTAAIVRNNHHAAVDEVSDGTIEGIRRSLHHDHLPRIEAAGLIEYDSDTHCVECTEEFGEVQPHLASILDADPVLGAPQPA